MARMTDDELDDVYFQAFNANWRKTGRGDSSDTAGLRAVADAAERRVLDRIADETNWITDRNRDPVREPAEWWSKLADFIDEMREELNRGDG